MIRVGIMEKRGVASEVPLIVSEYKMNQDPAGHDMTSLQRMCPYLPSNI